MNNTSSDQNGKKSTLYRMVTEEHVCPFGLKSKALLEREGWTVDDHWLTDRENIDAFKEKHGVENLVMILMGIWMPLRMYVLQF